MPLLLRKIMNNDIFDIIICSIVKEEINKKHYNILNDFLSVFEEFNYSQYSEVLRPLLSTDQLTKGEHEVILAAYITYHTREKHELIVIIDDKDARTLVSRNFPELSDKITGTLGFILLSYCKYHLIERSDVEKILSLVKNTKFRIDNGVLNRLMNKYKWCLDNE